MPESDGRPSTTPATTSPPRPLLAFVRPFTTHVFNRFSRRFVHYLPAFALIVYRGRKSGKTYRTPMNAFRVGDTYVFALTYGSDVQWVKNVVAAGEADLQIGRNSIHLTDPELFVDPGRRLMPFPVRTILGLLRVTEFLRMHVVPGGLVTVADGAASVFDAALADQLDGTADTVQEMLLAWTQTDAVDVPRLVNQS